MASKFNVGDKVKLTDAYPIGETPNETDIAQRGAELVVSGPEDYFGLNAFRVVNDWGIFLDDEAELVEAAQ